MNKAIKHLIMLFLILSVVTLFGCAPKEEPAPDPVPEEEERAEIPAPEDMILSAEEWKEEYPLIYESFIRTSRMKDDTVEEARLGGLHPIDYLQKYPNIKVLYEGIGFSKEYYAARGHYYSLVDVVNSARPKPGASCLACKTAAWEKLNVEYGSEAAAKDFIETANEVDIGISCYNCHRNDPGKEIQVTNPHLINALENNNIEFKAGTLACAQCHTEYYLDKESKEVILPWDKGLGVDDIEAYYDEMNWFDWEHPRAGTPLIKVQHPEVELYSGSVHDNLGVSCADCHMPTVTENGESYKSHWAKSPLKTVEESCARCHGDSEDALIEEVQQLQQKVSELEGELGQMLVQLIEGLSAARESKSLEDKTIEEVQALHRKAQYRWDFVFVENSTGFHNYEKAVETLEKGKEYAQQALDILEK